MIEPSCLGGWYGMYVCTFVSMYNFVLLILPYVKSQFHTYFIDGEQLE